MTGGSDAKAKAIFEQALDADPADRKAILDAACAGDQALRARVETLLAGAERDDLFLSDPNLNPPPAPVTEQPGAWIGPYRLIRLLGEGGFGSVFLAQQEQPVKREVALKIIKLGMDTRAVIARFEQERQALAVMDHPNIAKVLDAGATATGRPYFVMELVRGEPITDYCDKHALSITDRISLFTQVCNAVQHAHTKGIIHRDLKPGNVLVSAEDARATVITTADDGGIQPVHTPPPGRVRVIDFGIAKATDRPLTEKTVFTEQRQLIGTPEYMSPEQAEGSRDLDTRTDVYSLGVLLYELLAGAPPFDPERLRSAAYAEVQRIIREVDPPRPSTRLSQSRLLLASVAAQRSIEPGRLNSLLKGELDWIVMRALEKDRARRYESPSALAADLSRYLGGEAVHAAPPSRTYIARKFIRRHRVPVGAAAALLIVLVLGATGTAVGFVQARQSAAVAKGEAKRADSEAAAARKSAATAQSVNALMTTMIARADRGVEDGRANVTVREVMDAAAKELDSGASAYEPGVAAAMAKSIGTTYRELNLYEPAERMMRVYADREMAVYGADSVEYGEALGELGEVLKARGSDQAAATYDKARAIALAQGERGADILAEIDVNRAVLFADNGDLDMAESLLKQSIATWEARSETGKASYVAAVNNLAAVNYQRGNIPEAEKYFTRSVELQRAAGPESAKDLRLTLHNLAGLQFSKHDLAAAEKTTREELALSRKLYGDVHLDTAAALESLGIIMGSQGDYAGEEKYAREALEVRRKLLAPGHSEIARSLRALAFALIDTGNLENAESALKASCEIQDKLPAMDDTQTLFPRYQLADLMARRGAFAEADEALKPFLAAAATGAPFQEGVKYEWMRQAGVCLQGALMAELGADAEKMKEAERLITGAANRLLVIAGKMGPRMRGQVVPAALERAVHFYQAWDKSDPGQGHGARAEEWKGKLDAFKSPAPSTDSK